MYKDDWIGLKALDEAGKLKFMSVEVNLAQMFRQSILNIQGDHLQLDKSSLDKITETYLS